MERPENRTSLQNERACAADERERDREVLRGMCTQGPGVLDEAAAVLERAAQVLLRSLWIESER
jgi:hypothetical protein